MKNLLLLTGFLLTLNLSAQEVTTYQELEDNLVKVVVYNGEKIVQEGYVKKENKLWKNTGTWKQFNEEGEMTLKVKYKDGVRVETVAYQDDKVIKVYRKD